MIVAKAKDGSGKKASCKKTVSTSSTPSKPNLPENNEMSDPSAYPTLNFAKDWMMGD